MKDKSSKKKVYFDCTFTYQSGLNTGIQRVVRNIIRRAHFLEESHNVTWVPIVSVFGKYFEISAEEVLKKKRLTPSFGLKIKLIFEFLKINALRLTRRNKFLHKMTDVVFCKIEKVLKLVFRALKYLRSCITVFQIGPTPIRFQAEDHLILLDAFWTYNIEESILNSSQSKPRVSAVIYDLIPLTHPQFVDDGTVDLFTRAIPRLLRIADHFICISESVKNEVIEYCKKSSQKEFKFDHFPLGSDFRPKSKSGDQLISSEFKDLFKNEPVWLTVGTIEPRKNHQFILDAFEKLWAEGNQDCLLIVGRVGWKNEQILDRILNHPELNNRLIFRSDTSDDELEFCYKKSVGLIFASVTEGFGLPIVEAKASGIKVLCSDIPVFREVGGDYAIYFSLNDSKYLCDAIKNAAMSESKKSINDLTAWDEATQVFFSKLNFH